MVLGSGGRTSLRERPRPTQSGPARVCSELVVGQGMLQASVTQSEPDSRGTDVAPERTGPGGAARRS
jgi:hypothetical protein